LGMGETSTASFTDQWGEVIASVCERVREREREISQ